MSGQEASDTSSLVQRALASVRLFRRKAFERSAAVTAGLRRGRRLATLMAMACAFTATTAFGQDMMGYQSYGAPAFMAGGPQAYSATPTQGLPPSFLSHPYISPFDHAFEQHFNSDGLWFRRTRPGITPGGPNSYFFNIDYVRTLYRTDHSEFGDPTVTPFDYVSLPDDAPGNFPDTLFYDVHDPIQVDRLPRLGVNGIRISGGFENDNDWGFSWNANWNPSGTTTFDARRIKDEQRFNSLDAIVLSASQGVANGSAIPPLVRNFEERRIVEDIILGRRVFDILDVETFGGFAGGDGPYGTTFDFLNRTLLVLPSINMQNGVGPITDPNTATLLRDPDGIQQIFDLDFVLARSVQTWGGGGHFSFGAGKELAGILMRPTVGGRYMRIDEGFFFRGANSGLFYTRSVLQNGIDDDGDAFIDEVDEGGGALNFVQNNPSAQILIRSFINSTVRTDLYGPEIGVEYNLGDKFGLDLTGATRVGAFFNRERLNLAGDNIGDTVTTVIDPITGNTILQDMFDTTTLDGPTLNAFRDSTSKSHLSPMFEQSLNAELSLFSNVPVLRDMQQLEHAKLRLGWTFTWLGEIADPNKSIVWISNPRQGLFPTVNPSRTSFYQNTFNVGVNWDY
ncbi:MAG: hypothetical protein R3C19_14730 [Planctomycetaceae bacterium]